MTTLLIAFYFYFYIPDSVRIFIPDTSIVLKKEAGIITMDTIVKYKIKYVQVVEQRVFDKLDQILKQIEKKD